MGSAAMVVELHVFHLCFDALYVHVAFPTLAITQPKAMELPTAVMSASGMTAAVSLDACKELMWS